MGLESAYWMREGGCPIACFLLILLICMQDSRMHLRAHFTALATS